MKFLLVVLCLVGPQRRDRVHPGGAERGDDAGDGAQGERETDADSIQAAQDWERVTSRYGARSFSSKPAVNLRPSINGLEVVVRYITRAPQRNALKSKLFQLIVDLLHKSAVEKTAKV